jgi:small subunit ribosomal protein S13e
VLIKKAVAVRKHLERNRKDKDSKVLVIRSQQKATSDTMQFRLILIESRIHRLSR